MTKLTFCYNRSASNSLRRQNLRQGSSSTMNQIHTASTSAATSATLDMQVFRRVNRGTLTIWFLFAAF